MPSARTIVGRSPRSDGKNDAGAGRSVVWAIRSLLVHVWCAGHGSAFRVPTCARGDAARRRGSRQDSVYFIPGRRASEFIAPPSEHLLMPRRKRKSSVRALVLPILPVRNTVLFPHVVTPLFVDRDRSLRAIEESMGGERTLVVIAQRDPEIERPGQDDLYMIGTEAVVGRMLKMPDGSTSALVQGQRRVKVVGFETDEPYLRLS